MPDYDRPERNYLTRWRLIQTPWFGIYLHRFDGPDPRLTLHDHPWSFRSLVLRGGYIEATKYAEDHRGLLVVPPGCDIPRDSLDEHGAWMTYPQGTWNEKRATDKHTIVRLLRVPTWTLMLVGPRVREWGYVDPDGQWTRFDQHPNAAYFEAAMAQRKSGHFGGGQ